MLNSYNKSLEKMIVQEMNLIFTLTNGSLVRFIMALKMVVQPFVGSQGWVKLSKLL